MHPELALGFEVVANVPMDGSVDAAHLVLIDNFDGAEPFVVISVEDLIADRMGQYASRTAPEMLDQARRLFILHDDADLDYMDKRIRHESAGEYGVADLKG